VAETEEINSYDMEHRLTQYILSREAPSLWSHPIGSYVPPQPGDFTNQLLLSDSILSYDAVGNPIAITDGRTESEWPPGAKPVSRAVRYDDLDRLLLVNYSYPAGVDKQVSPNAFEAARSDRSPVPAAALPSRTLNQRFAHDWKGNLAASSDDLNAFYDRSLGALLFGGQGGQPDQLSPNGPLSVAYDETGNLVNLVISRSARCDDPIGRCSHRFVYDWDEVGKLARARRWDYDAIPPNDPPYPAVPATRATVDVTFRQGTGGHDMTSIDDGQGFETHSARIFPTLSLVRGRFDGTDFEQTKLTEVVYLAGLARVIPGSEELPHVGASSSPRLFLEFGDYLGSTTTVVDMPTSELVERITYFPYGATETDYRPERWSGFREETRFLSTSDIREVGLQAFGARYYHPALGRWISPDPLTIHGPGSDLNPYSYVRGAPLRLVDPIGLQPCLGKEDCGAIIGDPNGGFQFGPGTPSTSGAGQASTSGRGSQPYVARPPNPCPSGNCGVTDAYPPFNPIDNAFDRWLLHGNSWFHRFIQDDNALKNVQDTAAIVAVSAGAVAGVAGGAAAIGALTEASQAAAIYNTLVRGAAVLNELSLAEQGIVAGGGALGATVIARESGLLENEATAVLENQATGILANRQFGLAFQGAVGRSLGRTVDNNRLFWGGPININAKPDYVSEVALVEVKAHLRTVISYRTQIEAEINAAVASGRTYVLVTQMKARAAQPLIDAIRSANGIIVRFDPSTGAYIPW
jgi:RHS repeat-associated protein